MKILCSACLLGFKCKYNGGSNYNGKVADLAAKGRITAVCPEVMGGLPTPRVPSEIRDGKVVTKDGRDVDAQFRDGAEKCLEIAESQHPDLIILKSKSPSCGVRQHYDGTFSGKLVDGPGVTAELLIRNGFRVIEEKDLP